MSKEGFFWCELWAGVQAGLYPPSRHPDVTHWAAQAALKPRERLEVSRIIQPNSDIVVPSLLH